MNEPVDVRVGDTVQISYAGRYYEGNVEALLFVNVVVSFRCKNGNTKKIKVRKRHLKRDGDKRRFVVSAPEH